ncbi:DHA2 family efflux MFS transporter permease subunit [Paenibacillus sp. FSL R5-0527]|uniref:DHA2 family efflux MFS transporter permease subunit n=1 Tax=Paenibacillus sp. FSL R5-0527 TaxID=2975321 RepID=UPI00097A7675|nr:MFS transporter [Paenibacillus macerans]
MKGRKTGLIIASLIVANFMAQLMQTMLNTALPQMMQDLGISANRAQWLITVYLLVTGITIPVTGFLIRSYTTRTLFFVSVGAFTTGTLLAGFSSDFSFILAGRAIQGVGTGLLVPLFMNTMILVFPKEKIGAAMGLASLIVGLAPALGPTISGLVVQHHSWRVLFYGVAPITIANLVVAYFCLKNVGEIEKAKLDCRSILYSTLGFGGLLYGFSIVGEQGVSARLSWSIIAVGLFMVFLFVKRQFKLAVPLLDFNVFRYPRFTYPSIIGVILYIVMAGAELLLPIYAQNVRGLMPRESGLLLFPGALLMGLFGWLSGKIYDRFGLRLLIRAGFLFIVAVTLLLTLTLTVHMSYSLLVVIYALLMAGMGFMLTPITAFAVASLPGSISTYASPMTTAIRFLGMSMGGALLITMMTFTADASLAVFPVNMLEGIHAAFWALTAAAAVGFFLTFFIPFASVQPQVPESRQASY